MLVESSELPISTPGVCIVASCLLCFMLCWEQVGTSKWSWIQQCHGRNQFASHVPLCSSNLLSVVGGVCSANMCPLAICSNWVLALDYQHEIRCWPVAHLPLRRHSASNPYWVTWATGLVPEVCCHGARRCSADFPGRNKKPYVPSKLHLGGGSLLIWAVVRVSQHFFPLHSHHVSHEPPVRTRVSYLLQFASTWCTSNLAKLVRWWFFQSVSIYETHLWSLCPVPSCVGGNNTSF